MRAKILLISLALTALITVILFFPSATFRSKYSLNSPFIFTADNAAIWKSFFKSILALQETFLRDRWLVPDSNANGATPTWQANFLPDWNLLKAEVAIIVAMATCSPIPSTDVRMAF